MKWAYAVTTVPSRVENGLLGQTIASLAAAGFPEPRISLDGPGMPEGMPNHATVENTVIRVPQIGAYGNWVLTAWELFIRYPAMDRYAIFQDDFVAVRNLRGYLERCLYPMDGYLNLYTFPHNESPEAYKFQLKRKGDSMRTDRGWYLSDQTGKGAVALVFAQEQFRALLSQRHMVEHCTNVSRMRYGERRLACIDGSVVDSMRKAGYREFVHWPSLTQHTGVHSSIGNARHPEARTFPGEQFDALELLK